MKVSVVSIARNRRELEPLMEGLRNQTFEDFEFVHTTGMRIPQGWNDAISKANGEIIITVDSDVEMLSDTWLEEMVEAVEKYNEDDPEKKTIIKGIEISPRLPWTWCNVGCYADVLKRNRVDESYPIAEDTEFFTRLKKLGFRGLRLPVAPILHERSQEFGKIMRRSFKYGGLHARIHSEYGFIGFGSEKKRSSSILKRETMTILSRILYLLGAFVGTTSYHLNRSVRPAGGSRMDWRTEQKEVYDEMVKRSPTGHITIFSQESLALLDQILPRDGRILDMGSGTGHYAEVLSDREWYAVDISPECIEVAKDFYADARVGDVTRSIPYPDDFFDYVLASSIFHHVYRDIPDAVREAKRVLKPNGEIIVIDHDARNTHTRNLVSGPLRLAPTDERALYHSDIIEILREEDFEILETALLHISADQQALKPHIVIRVIKVLLMWCLDIFGERYPGEFLVRARAKK